MIAIRMFSHSVDNVSRHASMRKTRRVGSIVVSYGNWLPRVNQDSPVSPPTRGPGSRCPRGVAEAARAVAPNPEVALRVVRPRLPEAVPGRVNVTQACCGAGAPAPPRGCPRTCQRDPSVLWGSCARADPRPRPPSLRSGCASARVGQVWSKETITGASERRS
jgi:hypothetical protein